MAVPKCRCSGICRPRWISESPLIVFPGPFRSGSGVGAELSVDGVADPSFQTTHRFLAALPFGLFGEVIGAAGRVVGRLAERGDVDRVDQFAVAVRLEPMALCRSGWWCEWWRWVVADVNIGGGDTEAVGAS